MPGGIHPPISEIAKWPAPNLMNPEKRDTHNQVVILSAVVGTLAVCSVLSRLWIRLVVQKSLGTDDWTILAACVPLVGLAVGICLGIKRYDFDLHIWDVRIENYVAQRKIIFANEICYLLSTCLIKISILLFYRRLTKVPVTPVFVYAVWAALLFVTAYMGSFSILILVSCRPLAAFWNQFDAFWAESHASFVCIDEGPALLAASSVSIAQDLIAALLPLHLFWNLQVSLRQKVAMAGVFLVGLFLCVSGALRIFYIYKIFWTTYDVSWESYPLWIWTLIEVLVAPILASLPAFKIIIWRRLSRNSSLGVGSHMRESKGQPHCGGSEKTWKDMEWGHESQLGRNKSSLRRSDDQERPRTRQDSYAAMLNQRSYSYSNSTAASHEEETNTSTPERVAHASSSAAGPVSPTTPTWLVA